MVRIPGFHCCDPGSIPGQGTEILQAVWHGQNKKLQNKVYSRIPFVHKHPPKHINIYMSVHVCICIKICKDVH